MTAMIETVLDEPVTPTHDEDGDDVIVERSIHGPEEHVGLPRLGLGILAIVVAVGRLLYSAERTIYHLLPDEPATIGVARWLSGTGSWNMFEADVWRPGAALLVTPLYWITDDQTAIIRLSLVLGAVVAGWSAVWLARIVARLTDLEPRATLLVSGAVALMPAALSASAFVWAEPLVTLTFLAALWHLMVHVERPSLRHALGATLWASIGLTVHNRLMPMLVVVLVVVLLRSMRARRWREIAATVGIAASMFAAGQWLLAVVVDNVWENPGTTNTVGGTLGRLANPLAVLDAAVGQIWYLLAASAMLFGIGAIVLTRTAIDRVDPRRVDARLVLLVTGVLVATSIVFMSDRWRTDHLVYGRYNDAVVWPILAVGGAWLIGAFRTESTVVRRWMILAPAATCAVFTLVLIGLHSDQFERFPAFTTMIAGLQPAMSRTYILQPALVAVVAFVVFGLLLVGARARGLVMGVLVGSLVVVGGVATRHTVAPKVNFSQRTEIVEELSGEVIPAGSTVGVRFIPNSERPPVPLAYQATYWYLYQWFLDDMTFEIDTGLDDGVGPYVFSTIDDPEMTEVGADQIWTDPYVPLALWREPRARSD